jgi:hypothetical protein
LLIEHLEAEDLEMVARHALMEGHPRRHASVMPAGSKRLASSSTSASTSVDSSSERREASPASLSSGTRSS